MDTVLHVIGRLALFLVVIILSVAAVVGILGQFRRGPFLALLLGPAATAAVTYWFTGRPYWILTWCVALFFYSLFAFAYVPTHQTKSGGADRRYKNNPDASEITGIQRVTSLLGALGLVAVMVAAWLLHLPGSTLK